MGARAEVNITKLVDMRETSRTRGGGLLSVWVTRPCRPHLPPQDPDDDQGPGVLQGRPCESAERAMGGKPTWRDDIRHKRSSPHSKLRTLSRLRIDDGEFRRGRRTWGGRPTSTGTGPGRPQRSTTGPASARGGNCRGGRELGRVCLDVFDIQSRNTLECFSTLRYALEINTFA